MIHFDKGFKGWVDFVFVDKVEGGYIGVFAGLYGKDGNAFTLYVVDSKGRDDGVVIWIPALSSRALVVALASTWGGVYIGWAVEVIGICISQQRIGVSFVLG